MSAASTDYEQDFYLWATRNAELLRQRRFADIDADHIAEELEEMGRSSRRALSSRLANPTHFFTGCALGLL